MRPSSTAPTLLVHLNPEIDDQWPLPHRVTVSPVLPTHISKKENAPSKLSRCTFFCSWLKAKLPHCCRTVNWKYKLAIGFLCFVIFTVPILYYLKEVGISTDGEDATVMSVHAVKMHQHGIASDMKVSLFSPSRIPVSVPSFLLTLYLDGKKFGAVYTHPIDRLSYGINIIEFEGIVTLITDQQVLDESVAKLLDGEEIETKMSASAIAYAPFPVRINIEKIIPASLVGEDGEMHSYEQFAMHSLKFETIKFSPMRGVVSFIMDAYNPTSLSAADLGPIATDIHMEGKYVASLRSVNDSMPLVPGWNKFKFRMEVQPKFGHNIIVLGRMLTKMLKKEAMDVTLKGRPDSTIHHILKQSMSQFKYDLSIPPLGKYEAEGGPSPLALSADGPSHLMLLPPPPSPPLSSTPPSTAPTAPAPPADP